MSPPRIWWSPDTSVLIGGDDAPEGMVWRFNTDEWVELPADAMELRPASMPDRDDEVAAWIKRHRDETGGGPGIGEWESLNSLLDDYRLHADTGTPLSEVAHDGPYGEAAP